ncbi:LysR family transcriptional regulator [Paramagnetospirillum caucaseum]|uniref:LysR family transcriptional regulator n=1 Tax=Paramagnetospirillum caucaseum TaxID=1244869 RepID=M3A8B8_9PROT|nr:hydrogen peroxide-inducible genes activator [Paramagnetospirillum caucaseum]EME68759.1 LysR family transcriptional regulator [Paramagnetospirillum caucaseum]
MITLRHLQCFAAVAEKLHFRRAAEQINISQPALSAQIAQLEETLGVLLLERTRRRVLLTPIGQDLAERANAILRSVSDLEEHAQGARIPLSGILRLGVLPTLGPYLLPHFLPEMRRRHPDLKLYLREEAGDRLLGELASGQLDLILTSSAPASDQHLTVVPLFREPLWAVLPRGHRLAGQDSLTPADLAGEQLILLEVGDGLREAALTLCHAAGSREHPDFRATSLDSLRQMVATGLGATCLPALYVDAEARADEQIVVRRFADPPPSRPVDLVWRRTSARSPEFRLFAELVATHLPDVVTRSR